MWVGVIPAESIQTLIVFIMFLWIVKLDFICSSCAEWVPTLWLDTFNELLYDDNELDYEEEWTLNFNYSQTDEVTHDERKRGWKVYSHCAYGKYGLIFFLQTFSNDIFQTCPKAGIDKNALSYEILQDVTRMCR